MAPNTAHLFLLTIPAFAYGPGRSSGILPLKKHVIPMSAPEAKVADLYEGLTKEKKGKANLQVKNIVQNPSHNFPRVVTFFSSTPRTKRDTKHIVCVAELFGWGEGLAQMRVDLLFLVHVYACPIVDDRNTHAS
eukprot:58470-Amorphochlora_amoeboformis.AAC.1